MFTRENRAGTTPPRRAMRTPWLVVASAGCACVLAAASAWLGPVGAFAGLVPALALYHRLQPQETFENETRRRIYDYIREMPGACIADIASRVGVSHSTASYHLGKLNDFNLITATQDGNKMRFFMRSGAFSEEERRALAALENGETRRVLHTIAENPGSYRAELTSLLGVSSPTVNWHLDRLTRAKLVKEQQVGRNRYLEASREDSIRILSSLLTKLESTGKDPAGLESLLRILVERKSSPDGRRGLDATA